MFHELELKRLSELGFDEVVRTGIGRIIGIYGRHGKIGIESLQKQMSQIKKMPVTKNKHLPLVFTV